MSAHAAVRARRAEVLRLRREGLDNTAIARHLGVKRATVENDVYLLRRAGRDVPRLAMAGRTCPAGPVPPCPPTVPYRGRRPGEAPCRCLWCGAWACHEWLSLCPACRAWYEAATVDMPAEGTPAC